jgi:hypothetical protein
MARIRIVSLSHFIKWEHNQKNAEFRLTWAQFPPGRTHPNSKP